MDKKIINRNREKGIQKYRVTGAGIFTDHWQNKITKEEYLLHFERMESYGHPTGTGAMKELNKKVLMNSKQNKIRKNEDELYPPNVSGGE